MLIDTYKKNANFYIDVLIDSRGSIVSYPIKEIKDAHFLIWTNDLGRSTYHVWPFGTYHGRLCEVDGNTFLTCLEYSCGNCRWSMGLESLKMDNTYNLMAWARGPDNNIFSPILK